MSTPLFLRDAPPPWWPHRLRSRLQRVGRLRWHWQHWAAPSSAGVDPQAPSTRRAPDTRGALAAVIAGRTSATLSRAPVVLLLHGTGASAHSWRALAPLLAEAAPGFEVLAPDLPGHGFTLTPPGHPLNVAAMADALDQWLATLGVEPDVLIGHSAGAALAAQWALLRQARGAVHPPALLVSINGAWLPWRGPAGLLFPPLAKALSRSPLSAPAFSAWASLPGQVRRLLRSTGSEIDGLGERCYRRLVTDRRHVAGALRMMAAWDLESLQPQLPALALPVWLLAGAEDSTVPPSQAHEVSASLCDARLAVLPGLGHLAHEEDAAAVLVHCLKAVAAVAAAGTVVAPSVVSASKAVLAA